MDCINGIFALKVCYSPGNPENSMVGAARKTQFCHTLSEGPFAVFGEGTELFNKPSGDAGIAAAELLLAKRCRLIALLMRSDPEPFPLYFHSP
jgi:hypothetical protein